MSVEGKRPSENDATGTMTIDDRLDLCFEPADTFTWDSTVSADKTNAPKAEHNPSATSLSVPPTIIRRPETFQSRLFNVKALSYQVQVSVNALSDRFEWNSQGAGKEHVSSYGPAFQAVPEAHFQQTLRECIAGFRRFLTGRRRLLDRSDEEIAAHYASEYLLSYRSCSKRLQAVVAPLLIAEGVHTFRRRQGKRLISK